MSTTRRQTFPPKLLGETRFYEFDFSGDLASGETFSTMTVTASVYSGVDASPQNIVSGAEVNDNPRVKQLFTGGVLGTIYIILCTVVTSAGQTLQRAGYLAIQSDVP